MKRHGQVQNNCIECKRRIFSAYFLPVCLQRFNPLLFLEERNVAFEFSFLILLFFERQQRIAEIQKVQQASKFGDVREISAQDYVDEVSKAGKGLWVVLHLYKSGYPFHK